MYRPFFLGLIFSLAVAMLTANAAQVLKRFNQPEQRDAQGRLTTEAATVTVLQCNGAGENGGQFYIYQYVKRGGFRVIQAPYWSQPIGGRDWTTYDQAVGVACGGSGSSSGSNITGTWRLTSTCVYSQPAWAATLSIVERADGSLTVTTSNDNLHTTLTGPGLPENHGTNVRPQVTGSTVTMAFHPVTWDTVLELTGTVNGTQIDGRVHNTDGSNCTFHMVRQ